MTTSGGAPMQSLVSHDFRDKSGLVLAGPLLARSAVGPRVTEALGELGAIDAEALLRQAYPLYPTPLHHLPALAARLGVARLDVKDECKRLGLGSFKALGGAHAVLRLVLGHLTRTMDRNVAVRDLRDREIRARAAQVTFACATDGNHGVAVAAAAQHVGARAVIFVHERVAEVRLRAIADFEPRIEHVRGTYDDAVAAAARASRAHQWISVSDTSQSLDDAAPMLVMQGYSVLVREAVQQLSQPPSHVFVQAGVGGLAAAVSAHMSLVFGVNRPSLIIVEPELAACVQASVKAGRPVRISPGEATGMAMLECFEPSHSAYAILSNCADAFLTVSDAQAADAARRLATPVMGDPAVLTTMSGAAGLAGLLCATQDHELRGALRIGAESRILIVATESARSEAAR
jgi:diaminopropionate ammonia-lyase